MTIVGARTPSGDFRLGDMLDLPFGDGEFHMWHAGLPAEQQCEGCTFFNRQVCEMAYLHSRDVTYETFCEGPHDESVRYRDFMAWDMPWYSAQDFAETQFAERWYGMQGCYLRDGDRVFETY